VPEADEGTREFLGVGAAFPFALDDTGAIRTSGYEQHVREAVRIILTTELGERMMRPTFGSTMSSLAFAPLTASTAAVAAHIVTEALTRCEPRIDVVDGSADARPGAGALLINIRYRVRRTDTLFNLVYPFYVERGSDGGT
jgi:uncharacterized protein